MAQVVSSTFQSSWQEIEQRYRQQVIEHYNRLTLTGLPERDPGLHGVPLEKVFVKLNVETRQVATLDIAAQRELERLRQELAELEKEAGRGNRRRMQELRARIERLEREARQPQVETLSVAEALQQYQRLAVIGGPGSGKTTLTRWLALTFAQNRQAEPDRLGPAFSQPRLPILLELRRFPFPLNKSSKHPIPDLADEIATYISEHAFYKGTPKSFILDVLNEGRGLLLVDGLDEIADLNVRRNLLDALNALLQRSDGRYGENLCIVTSRPHGYRDIDLGAGFQTAQVKPFEPEDVHHFIRHWYDTAYGAEAEEEAQTLIEAIDQNDRVQDLATNPLLCTIIAIVYRNNRVLPNRRVELYLKCSEAMLDTWERNKAIRNSGLIGKYDWQTKIELLAPLAYWLHNETERLAAPEADFVEELARVLVEKGLETQARAKEEARRFLSAIRDRSGLLQGRGDGSLEFAHRTFQEYLAARYIAAQPDPDYIDLVMPHLHEAWWREVHLLAIGHLGSGSDGAEKASKLLLYILRLYKPPLRILRPTVLSIPKWLDNLLSKYEKHRIFQWLIFTVVLILASPYIIRMLLAAHMPRWQLQRRLAWVLAREFEFAAAGFQDCTPLGTTDTARHILAEEAESLLLQIVRDPGRQEWYHNILQVAVSVLVQLGQASPEVIHALLQALGDRDWRVRQAAASSLVQLGQASPEVIHALLQALGDNDWRVRQAAASSLIQLGQASPEVIHALIQALGDNDWRVRQAAASSLGQLGQASPEVIHVLIRALGDSDSDVQLAAGSSLVQLGQASPVAIHALLQALSDSDSGVRWAAANILGTLGQAIPEAIHALLQALSDSDFGVRQAAISSLVQLGQASPEVIHALIRALGDSDSDVRQAAASSLGQLGQASPEVIHALIQALGDSDSYVRQTAASSLVQLGQASPEVIHALLQALGDNDWRVRQAAASSLVQLGQASPEVIHALLQALGDNDWRVRQAATSSLGQLGQASPEVIHVLIRALGDSDWHVRKAAAIRLGQLGQAMPEVIHALLQALGDNDSGVRWAAASSLGQLGQASPEVIHALFRALDDSDSDVRLAATSSLGQLEIEDEKILQYVHVLISLNRRLHDFDDSVRRIALEAIRSLLDGRPIPGYHWQFLRKKQEKRQKLKKLGVGFGLGFVLILIALVATWLLTDVPPNSFVVRFLTALGGMAAFAAAITGILGWTLGEHWNR